MNSMQIQCFLKAASCLNFTESAAELFITQPSLSHNISALENEWGIELFIRDNKHKDTRLTPAGAVLFDGLKNLNSQFETLLQKARDIHSGKAGALRVGLISSDRIDDRTLNLFDRFQEKFPDVDMSLRRGSHGELIQWLQNDTLDMAIALKIDVENKPWIAFKPLYEDESVLLLTAEHPLAHHENLSLTDFKDETFVSVSAKESTALNSLFKQECERAGFTPKVLEAPDINAQNLLLESGKGVAIGSVNNTAAFNRHIVMVKLRELHPLELVMAWNRTNYNPTIALFHTAYEPIE